MIKRLTLENFQKHRSFKLKLSPHVTTIIGPSDIGKSAIFRALGWIVFNRPAGDDFIHEDFDTASATLHVDGHEIGRTKGKRNVYTLNTEEFVAFGQDVPEPVSTILNLSKINFQAQHDSAFWFSESAGEVSRQINQIVNLKVIDSTLSSIASSLRKSRVEMEVCESRLEAAEKKRTTLRRVRTMDRDLKKIETLEEKSFILRNKLRTLQELITKTNNAQWWYDQSYDAACEGEQVISKGEYWEIQRSRRESLGRSFEKGSILQASIHESLPDTSSLVRQADKIRAVTHLIGSLLVKINAVGLLQGGLQQQCQDIKKAKAQLKKRIGKECPLCEQPIL